jgi:hypothetical protein
VFSGSFNVFILKYLRMVEAFSHVALRHIINCPQTVLTAIKIKNNDGDG